MQKARAKLPVFFIVLTVTVACVMRFFQLINDTDLKTGMIVSNGNASFAVYMAVLLTAVSAVVFSVMNKSLTFALGDCNESKALFLSAVFLSLSMFADFVHQCFNCYDYIQSVSFIEYAYLIPLALSALFALLCCLYFLILAVSFRRSDYDFGNFTWFHIIPVIWAFTKLFRIMIKIVDIRLGVEVFIEFLLIVFIFCFLFSFLYAVDNKNKNASGFLAFSCIMTSSLCAVLVLPRYAVFIFGKGDLLSEVTYTSCTYIMFGLFTLAFLCDLVRRSNKKD